MSFFTAANVVVPGSGGGSSPSPFKVTAWDSAVSYSDGQVVIFNGSQYVAQGSPGVGMVPPIEVASPVVKNQPRWLLAARGRSTPTEYDDRATYYADQVVTYLGGTWILDAPTVPAGMAPNRDSRWTRLSETLTEAEAERLATSDLFNFATDTSAFMVALGDEVPRVRHHWVRVNILNPIGQTAVLYQCRFPRPIRAAARPQITIQATDQPGAFALLAATPLIGNNQVTGYSVGIENGKASGTFDIFVTIKEQIDQVRR